MQYSIEQIINSGVKLKAKNSIINTLGLSYRAEDLEDKHKVIYQLYQVETINDMIGNSKEREIIKFFLIDKKTNEVIDLGTLKHNWELNNYAL